MTVSFSMNRHGTIRFCCEHKTDLTPGTVIDMNKECICDDCMKQMIEALSLLIQTQIDKIKVEQEIEKKKKEDENKGIPVEIVEIIRKGKGR